MFIGYIDPDMILMTGEMAILNNKELVSFFFIHFLSACQFDQGVIVLRVHRFCFQSLFILKIWIQKKGKRKVKINETSRGVSLWLRLFIFAFHPKQEMECDPCRIEVQPIIIMTLWCSGLLIPQYRCGMALQVDNLI